MEEEIWLKCNPANKPLLWFAKFWTKVSLIFRRWWAPLTIRKIMSRVFYCPFAFWTSSSDFIFKKFYKVTAVRTLNIKDWIKSPFLKIITRTLSYIQHAFWSLILYKHIKEKSSLLLQPGKCFLIWPKYAYFNIPLYINI